MQHISNEAANPNTRIGFIGGGNMAASLIGGLLADGYNAANIYVADPIAEARSALAAKFGVRVLDNNAALADSADVIVLAVKPQQLKTVCADLPPVTGKLVISIAAGIRAPAIDQWLGGNNALVRCMPNTPALVRSGATGLYANAQVTTQQKQLAESLLRAVGITIWVDNESDLDAVTAVSGSGPAYYFLVMEAMQAAAAELGLSANAARLLTLQTAFGAAKMALESSDNAATLRERVTSPGGTTERALMALEEAGLRQAFQDALTAARDRSTELAEILENA